MNVLSLLRYTTSRCALSQVWVPPWVAFVLLIAVSYPSGAAALGSISLGIVILLVTSTWIGLATVNSESASQRASLAAAHGGVVRYRLITLLSAALASGLLIPLSVSWAVINDPARPSPAELTAAVLGHLVVVATGIAVAAVVSRPLVDRTGHAFVLAALILVVLVAVPHLPPVRLMVETLGAQRPNLHTAWLTTTTALPFAGLVAWGSAALGWRRQ